MFPVLHIFSICVGNAWRHHIYYIGFYNENRLKLQLQIDNLCLFVSESSMCQNSALNRECIIYSWVIPGTSHSILIAIEAMNFRNSEDAHFVVSLPILASVGIVSDIKLTGWWKQYRILKALFSENNGIWKEGGWKRRNKVIFFNERLSFRRNLGNGTLSKCLSTCLSQLFSNL